MRARGVRSVVLLCVVVLLVAACGGTAHHTADATSSSPAPAAVAPVRTTPKVEQTPAPDTSTRAAAQAALDDATDAMIDDATGRFTTAVSMVHLPVRTTGRFDLRAPASRWAITMPTTGGRTVTFSYRALSHSLYSQVSGEEPCWFHYDDEDLGISGLTGQDAEYAAYASALPAALYPVFDASAQGFVGSGHRVVGATTALSTVLLATFPRLASTMKHQKHDDAPVPITVTLSHGKIASVHVAMHDVVETALEEHVDIFTALKGQGVKGVLGRLAFAGAHATISFGHWGSAVSVKRPAADKLIEVDLKAARAGQQVTPCVARERISS